MRWSFPRKEEKAENTHVHWFINRLEKVSAVPVFQGALISAVEGIGRN